MKDNAQLFANPVLEKMSKSNALIVISALALLALAVFSYALIVIQISLPTKWLLFLSGFFSFTLAEYLIHRFVFHTKGYDNKNNWHYKIHGIHHTCPRDKQRLALPLPLAVGIVTALFFLVRSIVGQTTFLFFPGFIAGYAFYLFVHYTIHTRRAPKNIFRALWRYHYIHHFKNDHQAYGVTTPFWDIVFGTMPPRINRPDL